MDDPLNKWLPDQAAKIPNGDKVTLRQLGQNHTGIPDYADPIIGKAIMGSTFDQASLEKGYTPEELVDFALSSGTPSFEPGQGWEYSTTNFILLGMAIEKATGKPISELYQQRIFDPLGMQDTFLLNDVPEPGSVVNGYYTMENKQVVNVTTWNGSQGWAGGSLVSDQIALRGYDARLAAGVVEVNVLWQTLAQPPHAYTVFAHVVDANGQQVGQQDNMPVRDQLPTTCWMPGEYVSDPYSISLAADARGPLKVELGLYRGDTGARLPRSDAQGESITLAVP